MQNQVKKQKQLLIDRELFNKLVIYFIYEQTSNKELFEEIKNGVLKKAEKVRNKL